MSTKIQNKNASVENENLVAIIKNEVVQNATLTIFEEISNLESMTILSEIISEEIAVEFMHQSFMSQQLELAILRFRRVACLYPLTV